MESLHRTVQVKEFGGKNDKHLSSLIHFSHPNQCVRSQGELCCENSLHLNME